MTLVVKKTINTSPGLLLIIVMEKNNNVDLCLQLFLGSTENPVTSYTTQANDSQTNFEVRIIYYTVMNP